MFDGGGDGGAMVTVTTVTAVAMTLMLLSDDGCLRHMHAKGGGLRETYLDPSRAVFVVATGRRGR